MSHLSFKLVQLSDIFVISNIYMYISSPKSGKYYEHVNCVTEKRQHIKTNWFAHLDIIAVRGEIET